MAFCIIVGDTIPHVIAAAFPSLTDTPFLWLLTNRQAVIIIFILGVSYPLSLYRDISKVRISQSSFWCCGQSVLSADDSSAGKSVFAGINQHDCNNSHDHCPRWKGSSGRPG